MNRTLRDKLPELEVRDEITLLARNYPLSQQILRTDVSGMPLEWIDYREAAGLYHTDQVAYTCGTPLYRLYGGTCARTGLRRSSTSTPSSPRSVTRESGESARRRLYAAAQQSDFVPTRRLFVPVLRRALPLQPAVARPRDTVQPRRQGHVAQRRVGLPPLQQCKGFAHSGASRHAASGGAVHADLCGVHLPQGRRVLADQMEYPIAHFPRSSLLHERMQRWPM